MRAVCNRNGEILKFNCLDGELLDITVNGVKQSTAVPTCDKPVQLGLTVVANVCLLAPSSGQDQPNNQRTTLAICRKYSVHSNKGEKDPIFDDIALFSTTGSRVDLLLPEPLESIWMDVRCKPSNNAPETKNFWMDTGDVDMTVPSRVFTARMSCGGPLRVVVLYRPEG